MFLYFYLKCIFNNFIKKLWYIVLALIILIIISIYHIAKKIILESKDDNFEQIPLQIVSDVTADSNYLNVNHINLNKELKTTRVCKV